MTSTVTGVSQLATVGAALKRAGGGQLRKDTLAGIRREGAPAVAAIKARGLATIPSRGGLAGQVAAGIGVRTRLSGRSVGIQLIRSRRTRRGAADMLDSAGTVRHPVWGNREAWVTQAAPAAQGWFTDEAADRAAKFRAGIDRVLAQTAEQIVRSV